MSERDFDPTTDYPIAEKRPELVRTALDKPLSAVTLDAVIEGTIIAKDLRITPDALHRQGAVAAASGQPALVANFSRAAELANLPDEYLMSICTALRPRRSSPAELRAIADELETVHNAPLNAKFVREAASAYEQRGLLPEGA